jgi:hypothetical protein
MALYRAEVRCQTLDKDLEEPWNSICADSKWNIVGGIVLEIGRPYSISVKGFWNDASIHVAATGYASDSDLVSQWKHIFFSWVEPWRRAPDADWFSLICVVGGESGMRLDIGGMLKGKILKSGGSGEVEITAPASGPLSCFANDLPLMYWNNQGAISLRITSL